MNSVTKMTPEDSRELLRRELTNYFSLVQSQSFQTPSNCEHVAAVIGRMHGTAKRNDHAPDWNAVVEYWAELQRIGAISVLPFRSDDVRHIQDISTVVLSAWGRKLLEGSESSPDNPSRYFADLRKRVGTPDAIALVYLEEAVEAWAAGLNRSSAVMLGCACERLVRVLSAAVQSAGIDPWAQRLADHEKKVAAGNAAPMAISAVYEQVRSALQARADDKKLPGELADGLDRRLSGIFDQARMLRNRSGHPTGEDISSEDAHAGLLLFPGFHETVTRLAEALS